MLKNKLTINEREIYHEKQVGNYCRCHAMNNLFGSKIIPLPVFDKYCIEYDVKKNFEKNCSRRQIFYNFGGIDNIFGYSLTQSGKNVNMEHHDFYNIKNIDILKYKNKSGFIGFIVYNTYHTWCVRLINDKMYNIDSMRGNITEIKNNNALNHKMLGVISIFLLN